MRQLYFKEYESYIHHKNWNRCDKFLQENEMEIEYKVSQNSFLLNFFGEDLWGMKIREVI